MQPSNGRTSWITCSCPWCPIRCEAALLIENESLCLQFFTERSGGASLTCDPPRISPETGLPLELPRWVCQHGALPRWAAGNTATHVPPTQPLKKRIYVYIYLRSTPCLAPSGLQYLTGSGAELSSVGTANIAVLTLIVRVANGCSPCRGSQIGADSRG